MTIHKNKKITFLLVFFFFLQNIFCQTKSLFETYVNLDLPYGFICTKQTDSLGIYVHQHEDFNTFTEVQIYKKDKFNNSKDAIEKILTTFTYDFTSDSFTWNNKDCAIASLKVSTDSVYEGFAFVCETKDKEYYIFLISYCPSDYIDYGFNLIFSSINSFWSDGEDYFGPGIFLSYSYPKKGTKKISFTFDNKKFTSEIDKSDEEAAKTLIETEYNVFRMTYNKSNINEIRRRMYRLIYRDNSERIQNIIKDIVSEYKNKCTMLDFCQKVLTWTQNLPYNRAESLDESDITSFTQVFLDHGNDCDSRSMIICAFMQYVGIESVLFVSNDFSHAICGIKLEAPGQKFTVEKTSYLLGETTAKVTWGTIVKEHANPKKWDCIYLY